MTDRKLKFFDRASIILINLCILAVFIISPALIAASSPSYYKEQFRKNGIYAEVSENGSEKRTIIYNIDGNESYSAAFSDEQLDMLIEHIIEYLFGNKKSFELTMDGVMLNGTQTDGVSVFGDEAVSHMADVKNLMSIAKWAAIILAVLLIGLIVYVVKRRANIGKTALKYTLIFYAVLLSLIAIFLIATLIGYIDWVRINPEWYFDALWRNVHHLLFPFQPEKFEGSFFNDTLTEILTLELFLDAMLIVFVTLFSALAVWLGFVIWIRKRKRKTE